MFNDKAVLVSRKIEGKDARVDAIISASDPTLVESIH